MFCQSSWPGTAACFAVCCNRFWNARVDLRLIACGGNRLKMRTRPKADRLRTAGYIGSMGAWRALSWNCEHGWNQQMEGNPHCCSTACGWVVERCGKQLRREVPTWQYSDYILSNRQRGEPMTYQSIIIWPSSCKAFNGFKIEHKYSYIYTSKSDYISARLKLYLLENIYLATSYKQFSGRGIDTYNWQLNSLSVGVSF